MIEFNHDRARSSTIDTFKTKTGEKWRTEGRDDDNDDGDDVLKCAKLSRIVCTSGLAIANGQIAGYKNSHQGSHTAQQQIFFCQKTKETVKR